GIGVPFDAGVNILGVLAKDHHVDFLRLLDGARHAGEIPDRAQAHVQIELLTQGDIERADAAADGRGQRPFYRHHVIAHDSQRLVGKPDVGAVNPGRLLAGVDLHPVDLPLAVIGLRDGRVDDANHHGRDVEAGAVALDVRNDRIVGYVEAKILVDRDLLP